MKKTQLKLAVLVVVVLMVAVMALTGCGNADNPVDSTDNAATTDAGGDAAADTNADSGDSAANAGADNSGSSTTASAGSGSWMWGDAAWEAAVRSKVEGQTLKIGFTPPAASEFYDIIMHGAYSMMNELHDHFGVNFEFEFVAPSEHDAVESQIATIENWATKEFDVVLVCTAGDFDSMNSVYQKANDAGTAIYLFNMPAELWDENSINMVSCISYNNGLQAGALAGEYAAEKLNGEGKILFISGNDGHWTAARKQGFEDTIAKYPGLSIVAEQRGEYVRDKGMAAAENMLQANPDVNFIYGENEEMAQGAVQAIEAMGLKLWDGTEGIIVVGADGLVSGYEQISNGMLTATVDVGHVDMGREAIRSIFMHEMLGYTLDKVTNVPAILVDADNVAIPDAYAKWALSIEPAFN
ncbi:sugar ABC transporter substrate-binding protein [Christensenellaceae bacterium OttesenSCG-928-K19]|nr:sugar ABC transporter substrate-binding protein [Christensenellaceae bacterium OttesenSCG-928-K19]